jgi:hypothetical protein
MIVAAGLLATAGCDKTEPETRTDLVARGPATNAAAPEPGPATPADASEALRERAGRFWQAQQDGDWGTVYRFQDPEEIGAAYSEQDYIEWSKENEPIRVHSFELHQAIAQDDMGWVDLTNSTSLRRFPKVPPRETRRWQNWHRLDGTWYPVPQEQLENFPSSPTLRSAAEEERLRERFVESWNARRDRDFERMMELTDPGNRPELPETHQEDLFEYVDFDIHWVEARGTMGKVRVAIAYKATDPSLSKFPAKTVLVTEPWKMVDGEWYIDLGAAGAGN